MNLFVFLCSIWTIISSVQAGGQNEAANSFAPLAVVYYPSENIWSLSELDLIQKMISDRQLEKPRFTFVLLYCAIESSRQEFAQLYQAEIFTKARDALARQKTCEHHYQPGIFPYEDGYQYAIGYLVIGDIVNSITNQSKLPDFPIRSTQGEGPFHTHVIYIHTKFNGNHQTVHRFFYYKRSLIPSKSCNDYKLSRKYPSEAAIEQCYTEKNQDDVFQNLDIPDESRKLPQSESQNESSSEKQYFDPHQMVPLNDFIEDSMRMATCKTYRTITPIWRSISRGAIRIVEEFIQRIAEELDVGTLKVRTEIKDVLDLQTNTSGQKSKVYLPYNYREENKDYDALISVPKYFLKIVAYRPAVPYEQEQLHRESKMQRHYMVIVVHNELSHFSPRLCNKNKKPICKFYGWHVTIDEDEKGPVYCCTFEDKDLKAAIELYDDQEPFDLENILSEEILNEIKSSMKDLTTNLTQKRYNDLTIQDTKISDDVEGVDGISEISSLQD